MEVLIALLSSVVGGIVALIGNYLVSERTANMQMKTTVLSSYLTVRIDAFKEFLNALENWSNNRNSASCAEVYRASSLVSLVASKETVLALNEVQSVVREYELNGTTPDLDTFGNKLVALQFAMRADLLTYQAPEISTKRKK